MHMLDESHNPIVGTPNYTKHEFNGRSVSRGKGQAGSPAITAAITVCYWFHFLLHLYLPNLSVRRLRSFHRSDTSETHHGGLVLICTDDSGADLDDAIPHRKHYRDCSFMRSHLHA